MKSVGEVMAMGSNFQESLQKALRGLETGVHGLDPKIILNPESESDEYDLEQARECIKSELRMCGPDRIFYIADAFRFCFSREEIHTHTKIDPWFLAQIEELIHIEQYLREFHFAAPHAPLAASGTHAQASAPEIHLYFLKQRGFSDFRIATLLNTTEEKIRAQRHA